MASFALQNLSQKIWTQNRIIFCGKMKKKRQKTTSSLADNTKPKWASYVAQESLFSKKLHKKI